MLTVNDHSFFLVPVSLSKLDTDFNIFSASGEQIGTTLTGIHQGLYSEDVRFDIQTQLESKADQLESHLKFEKQFGIQIENVSSLNLSAVAIMDIMEKQWSIPADITDEMIGSYL
jgi:hypothetical protein